MTALYFGWPAFRNRHFVVGRGVWLGGGPPPPLYSSLVPVCVGDGGNHSAGLDAAGLCGMNSQPPSFGGPY